jgi:hypothetical protein
MTSQRPTISQKNRKKEVVFTGLTEPYGEDLNPVDREFVHVHFAHHAHHVHHVLFDHVELFHGLYRLEEKVLQELHLHPVSALPSA